MFYLQSYTFLEVAEWAVAPPSRPVRASGPHPVSGWQRNRGREHGLCCQTDLSCLARPGLARCHCWPLVCQTGAYAAGLSDDTGVRHGTQSDTARRWWHMLSLPGERPWGSSPHHHSALGFEPITLPVPLFTDLFCLLDVGTWLEISGLYLPSTAFWVF